MLKQRIATAAVLLPLFVAALFYLSSLWLALLLGVFVLAAAWEWTSLAGITRTKIRALYVVSLGLMGALGCVVTLYRPGWVLPVIAASVLWWCWAFYQLLANKTHLVSVPSKIISGIIILLPAWFAALYLHAQDPDRPRTLLFLFVLIWVADTSAFFAGRAWGKVKLAPTISPGKTVEGVLGGLVAVVVLAALCGTLIWGFKPAQLVLWLFVAVLTVVFSIVGDLLESKFKRAANIKDSGSLLPGHGGVLDRIDAFTAAAPVFVIAWVGLMRPQL